MKLNKIALAVIASAAPAVAMAGVTVSPLLLGYHYTGEADKEQRSVLHTGKQLNANNPTAGLSMPQSGGVTLESGLYTGAAIGIELTPSTQFQVEYGISDVDARASKISAQEPENRFDGKQEMITGNFLVGFDQFTGYTDSKFKPYVLIGAGRSKIEVENQVAYEADGTSNTGITAGQQVAAGTVVAESKDTIGNLGLGARYLVNDALALRGEARAIHNFDNNWWEGLALAGLEVTLGGRLTPHVPVPPTAEPVVEEIIVVEDVVVDSDMDGVPDHLDACPGTPRNLVVDARGCPVQVDIRDDLRLELRVFFDRNKSDIKPQYRDEVAKVAAMMREYPNATANIEGHASKDSNRSSAKYNQRLSEARANAVKSMLANEFGVAPNRLSAVGYGFNNPIAPNTTEEGRAQNRRVYAVITGDKTTTVDQTVDMQVR
ncbi:MAG: OmpA family protein [Moraxella sp.]|nr:OmpA family protein [Moraxella sp.]